MINSSAFIHYMTIACSVCITAAGVGLGQGLTGIASIEAMAIQPSVRAVLLRISIISMALIETVAIVGLLMAVLLLKKSDESYFYGDLSSIGIALAICSTGFILGIASAYPCKAAAHAIVRQPFIAPRILGFLMMILALMQTPLIASLIVAFLIRAQAAYATNINESIRLIASGLCMGIGTIGPIIGLSLFGHGACQSLGINRHAYKKLTTFTLISQAIIETPIIFCLVIACMIISMSALSVHDTTRAIGCISAALCIGVSTFGTGIGSGLTARKAAYHIASNPEIYTVISRTSLLAQGLIETSVIYAVIISFAIIWLS